RRHNRISTPSPYVVESTAVCAAGHPLFAGLFATAGGAGRQRRWTPLSSSVVPAVPTGARRATHQENPELPARSRLLRPAEHSAAKGVCLGWRKPGPAADSAGIDLAGRKSPQSHARSDKRDAVIATTIVGVIDVAPHGRLAPGFPASRSPGRHSNRRAVWVRRRRRRSASRA